MLPNARVCTWASQGTSEQQLVWKKPFPLTSMTVVSFMGNAHRHYSNARVAWSRQVTWWCGHNRTCWFILKWDSCLLCHRCYPVISSIQRLINSLIWAFVPLTRIAATVTWARIWLACLRKCGNAYGHGLSGTLENTSCCCCSCDHVEEMHACCDTLCLSHGLSQTQSCCQLLLPSSSSRWLNPGTRLATSITHASFLFRLAESWYMRNF